MAEGRMLKAKISTDGRWADLGNDTYRLLFTVGIAHLDVEGRIGGDPREFKAKVVPMLDHITAEVVDGFFTDASRLGLIRRYCVNGQWVVEYPNFKKNQSLRPDREGPSKFPPPIDKPAPLSDNSRSNPGEPPDHSRSTPPEVRLSKEKESEDKKGALSGKPGPIPYQEIVSYLNQKTGKNFQYSQRETQRLIRARWRRGYRLNDFKIVMDNKISQWGKDPKMVEYLRPETLFGTKFESYLNIKAKGGHQGGKKYDGIETEVNID
jgi:uncharacterized phage protein (TIGR02220 family)